MLCCWEFTAVWVRVIVGCIVTVGITARVRVGGGVFENVTDKAPVAVVGMDVKITVGVGGNDVWVFVLIAVDTLGVALTSVSVPPGEMAKFMGRLQAPSPPGPVARTRHV